MSKITLSTDIYDIAASVEEVKSQYIDEDEDTLAIDIFGYLGSIETRKIQSSIMVASELSNELFAQRAKYKRNLISHAINLNIEDINAIPAKMNVYLLLQYQDILDNLDDNNTFILDRNCSFDIGGYEFHPVYDVLIRRSLVKEGIDSTKEVFTAQYIIEHEDPNVEIDNPYLASPLTMIADGYKYVAVALQITQMSYATEYTSVITNSIIENKMSTFNFTDQLAYFEVIVNDKDYVTPIFEGSAVPDGVETWCYYTYMNENTVRVKFDRTSYSPKLNDTIRINIYTTKGEEGNFRYRDSKVVLGTLDSDKYGYSSIDYRLNALTDSLYGEDQKTKEELRKIIPKEALMKGIISTTDDLNNYFNMANTDDIILRAQKKIDNQTERTFYTYFVMKDSENNVVPTNTTNMYVSKLNLKEQILQDNKRYILPAGTVFGYDSIKDRLFVYDESVSRNNIITVDDESLETLGDDNNFYEIVDTEYGNLNMPNNFVYISPFTIIINDSPMFMQYYLTKINQNPYLDFKFINLNSPITFIGSNAHWERLFYSKKNTYTLSLPLTQNTNDKDLALIETIDLVPDSDELVKGKPIDLYEANMYDEYFKYCDISEEPDYKTCFKTYWFSSLNLDPLDTSITSQINEKNESEFITDLNDVDKIYNCLKNVTVSSSVSIYAIYKTPFDIYYPCKIGTLSVNVKVKRTYVPQIEYTEFPPNNENIDKTISGNTTTYSYKDNKGVSHVLYKITRTTERNVTTDTYKNEKDEVYSTVTYTRGDIKPEHFKFDLRKEHFMATIFDEYMVLDIQTDVYTTINSINTIDGLFYDTLTEAVANTLDKPGTYYVYTRRHGDILNIGSIEVDENNNYLYYHWSQYKTKVTDDETNIHSDYFITHEKFNVWEYVESDYIYYPTLKQVVAARKYDGKDKYYVYIKTTVNGEIISHPVYLGEINIDVKKVTDALNTTYYSANIKFLELMDVYKNTYDDYKDFYYISDVLVTSEIEADSYSKSLFNAILSRKDEVYNGDWFVYTHNQGDLNPILMGTINMSVINRIVKGKKEFACTYKWTSEEEYEVISHTKVFALFYKDGTPYRYEPMVIDIANSDVENSKFTFITQLHSLENSSTGVAFDNYNNIYIDKTYVPKTNHEKTEGYFNAKTDLDIYVFAEMRHDGEVVQYPHTGDLVSHYPGVNPETYFPEDEIKGYTLCNIYRAPDGINFYENYGTIMNSVVNPIESENEDGKTAGFSLTTVPVIGYRYAMDEAHISEVVDAIDLKKAYIDNVLDELENTIGIDFKFFNTFGPSKTFTLDQDSEYIDRVNVSLHFRVKLSEYNDETTVDRIKADAKDYIENLNYLDSEHISILITQINSDYEQEIDYFDFIGFNEYGPEKLHIYRDADEDIEIKTAPELLCVHNVYNKDTGSYDPDINIEVLRPY